MIDNVLRIRIGKRFGRLGSVSYTILAHVFLITKIIDNMGWIEEVRESKDIELNKTYRVRLDGFFNVKKVHIMHILDGYYSGKNQRLIVFRVWCRKRWVQQLLVEEDFKFKVALAK